MHTDTTTSHHFLFTDSSYSYIGCFYDVESDPDLDDSQIAFAADQLTVDECAFQCRESGSPYAGLHRGSVCNCGDSYGKHGFADALCKSMLIRSYSGESSGKLWKQCLDVVFAPHPTLSLSIMSDTKLQREFSSHMK